MVGHASFSRRIVVEPTTGRIVVHVQVVHASHDGKSGNIGEAKTEQTGKICLFSSYADSHICHIALAVFFLEVDVHHIFLLGTFVIQCLGFLRHLVIHLDFLHRVVGQVLQHQLVVASEEVLAVEQ